MFKSKKDIDRHVRANLSKLNENEKKYRGFTIAKLYFKINEFAIASNYVSDYLSVYKEKAPAYKLLGQCLLKLNKTDQALESFQKSLQLDVKQLDLLTEVCKIFLSKDFLENSVADYWCSLAETEGVQDTSVFKLRLKLSEKQNISSEIIENRIFAEIVNNPSDSNLRVQYIQQLCKQSKIVDAFNYVLGLELNTEDVFRPSAEWYHQVSILLSKFKSLKNIKYDWELYVLQTICLEKQLCLSFNDFGSQSVDNLTEIEDILFSFDQNLNEIAQLAGELCIQEIAAEFLKHFRGQLCLHIASLFLKREIIGSESWDKTSKKVLPLLLFAYQSEPPGLQQQWVNNLKENNLQLINLLNKEATFRCSQAGRIVLSYANILSTAEDYNFGKIDHLSEDFHFENINVIEFFNEIQEYCSNKMWRVKIYREIFTCSEKVLKISNSYFNSCNELLNPVLHFPSISQLKNYEEKAQQFKPHSLPHMVYLWLDLNSKSLNNFSECKIFSTSNLTCCNAETLNTLDMETFLYASVIQAKRSLKLNTDQFGKVQPTSLPFVNIQSDLCTQTQSNWWKFAYNTSKGVVDGKLGGTRSFLKYGIEAVRGVNEQKMDLIIILKLAKIFVRRSEKVSKTCEKHFIESRAFCLFKYGLQIWKKRNKESQQMLFSYPIGNCSLTKKSLHLLIEDAVQYAAMWYFQKSEYHDCIELLTGLKLPLAKYYLSEAYKNLGEFNELPNINQTLSFENSKENLPQTLNLHPKSDSNLNDFLFATTCSEFRPTSFKKCGTNHLDTEVCSDDQSHKAIVGTITSDIVDLECLNNIDKVQTSNKTISSIENLENVIRKIGETLEILKHEVIGSVRPEVKELRKDIAELKEKINVIEEKLNKEKSEALGPADLNEYLLAAASLQNELYPSQQTQQSFPHQNIENMHETQATNMQQQILNSYKSPLFHTNYMAANNFPQYAPPLQPKTCQNSFQRTNQINTVWTLANQHAQYENLNSHVSGMHNPSLEVQKISDFLSYLNQNTGINTSHPKSPYTLNDVSVQSQPQPVQSVPTFHSSLWNDSVLNNVLEKIPSEKTEIGKAYMTPFLNNTLTATTSSNSIIPVPPNNTFVFSSPIVTSTATLTTPPPFLTANILTSNINLPINKFVTSPIRETEASSKTIIQNENEFVEKVDIEYDPRPDFQPIIPLPAEITVSTGEENEEVLFSHKAKLFRFVDKEWKERGCGEIKILKNRENGKGRVLMRRDVTHKICANHTITSEIDLIQPSPRKDEKCYIWAAHDYADEELKVEKFCVRFKQVETAQEFHKVFTEVKSEAQINEKSIVSDNTGADQSTIMLRYPNSDDKISPFKDLNLSSLPITPSKAFGFLNKLETSTQNLLSEFDKKNVDGNFEQSATDRSEDDYVPTAQFKPVIALPDLIEVETGEENEKILFEHRAKLLRYDKPSLEWKERGLGNIKVLQARGNENKIRLVMRREKIQKLCCNQNLLKETKFIYPKNAKTKNSLIWIGQDFSENVLNIETLLLKFKTEDTCKLFLDTILKIQAAMRTEDGNVVQDKNNFTFPIGFGDKFKPKPGSWSCNNCYVQNSFEILYCLACNSPKDGNSDGVLNNIFVTSTQTPTFSFGFNNKVFDTTQTTRKNFANFSFGSNPVSNNVINSITSKSEVIESTTEYLQLNDKITTIEKSKDCATADMSADKIVSQDECTTMKDINSSISFAQTSEVNVYNSTEEHTFNFGKTEFKFNFSKIKSPGKTKFAAKFNARAGDIDVSEEYSEEEEEENDEEEDNADEEGNNIYFAPVVHLEKVEIKTGEEDEDVLYHQRAKLYRFVDKEWKERGLGGVKILKHKLSNKLRVVMRREQIHKICLNHLLTSMVEYKAKDDKSWLFSVNDFSEGEIEFMHFCVRFKTKEIAKKFIEEVKNALLNCPDVNTEGNLTKESEIASSQTVDFLDQQKKCNGCRGCNPDSFVFNNTLQLSKLQQTPLPLRMTIKTFKEKMPVIKQSLFSSPILKGKGIGFNDDHISKFEKKSYKIDDAHSFKLEQDDNSKSTTETIFEKSTSFGEVFFNKTFMQNKEEKLNFMRGISKELLDETSSKVMHESNFNEKPLNETSGLNEFTFTALLYNEDISTNEKVKVDENNSLNESNPPICKEDNSSRNLFQNNMDFLVDFASLAKSSANILEKSDQTKAKEFQGLIQQNSFDNFLKPKFNKSNVIDDFGKKHENTVNKVTEEASNFDPYYKPIIDLPKEIVVSTGEENEVKIFGERATLFRYDGTNKEWKERGVGEMKILHHPLNGTYRILLRREQIHKLVLNHTIAKDFILNEMNNSLKSFCWGAVNYADEQPKVEKLAIRFKNIELAKKFQEKIKECLTQLKMENN